MSHHKGQPSRTTGMAKPNMPKKQVRRVHCVICEKKFMQMNVTDECCSPKCYKVLNEKRKVLGKESEMSVGIMDELEACNTLLMKEQMQALKNIKSMKESLGGD